MLPAANKVLIVTGYFGQTNKFLLLKSEACLLTGATRIEACLQVDAIVRQWAKQFKWIHPQPVFHYIPQILVSVRYVKALDAMFFCLYAFLFCWGHRSFHGNPRQQHCVGSKISYTFFLLFAVTPSYPIYRSTDGRMDEKRFLDKQKYCSNEYLPLRGNAEFASNCLEAT